MQTLEFFNQTKKNLREMILYTKKRYRQKDKQILLYYSVYIYLFITFCFINL